MSTFANQAPQLLLVDGDTVGAELMREDLRRMGCEVELCDAGARLERLLVRSEWDVILLDQDSAPLETFEQVLGGPNPPVLVIMAGFGSIDEAVLAVRAGAADFLSKPVTADQLRVSLERALEQRSLRHENQRLREEVGERFALGKLHSRSGRMQEIFEMVRNVADTRATILIEGESGTGKTLLARAIHNHSSRASANFVEVNCGALPDALLESEFFGHERGAFTGAVKTKIGKFEAADGGTIFLDEISCASSGLQVKLLRVLQDREFEKVGSVITQKVDVRVIAASNQPLQAAVAAGDFREDLYYRLNVLGLQIPPLRERRGDVVELAELFLSRAAETYEREIMGFAPEAMAALTSYSWPGNIRELENLVERAVLISGGPNITSQALPHELTDKAEFEAGQPAVPGSGPLKLAGRDLKQALLAAERDLILETLIENNGSRNETARQLGINRTTLFNKMTKFDLMEHVFAPGEAGPDESRAQ